MTNFISAKNIHQGSELLEGQNFVVLICDIDDIKQRIEENDDKLSSKEIKEVYDLARRKLSDLIMDDFWFGLDALIQQVKDD